MGDVSHFIPSSVRQVSSRATFKFPWLGVENTREAREMLAKDLSLYKDGPQGATQDSTKDLEL